MEAPYLSIIIPTRQAEKTLGTALDSILQQSFKDLEILVIDSVSTDGTLAIARNAAERDRRVQVSSEPDKGVYDAMNNGIRQARGEWIYFLGSDDRFNDERVLSDVFSTPDKEADDVLYGNVVGPSYRGVYDGVFTYEKLLSRNVSHQACFYRRSLFVRLGDYNLRYRAYADWEFNIRCFSSRQIRLHFIDRVIASFGPGGLSSRHDVPFLKEVMFPAKLRLMAETGPRVLRRLAEYDDWWRLLRNAEFRGPATLEPAAGGLAVPKAIKGMAAWQMHIPLRTLRIGVCSKLCMFASYWRHLLTGTI
jgi:glycosyltransferase involved in cell wall biosynthesis